MKSQVRETELKLIFDRVDEGNMSEREKSLAKAYLLKADRIVELIFSVTTGLTRLTRLLFVKAVRRDIAPVSKAQINHAR